MEEVKIIEIIEKYLHGITPETLKKVTTEILELEADIDNDRRIVDVDLLSEILEFLTKLKQIHSTIQPQSTGDILAINDLNVLEYKLEVLINKLN